MKHGIVKFGSVILVWLGVANPWSPTPATASAQEKIDKAEAVKKELAALQGTWRFVSLEDKGKDKTVKDDGRVWVIDKDQMSFKLDKNDKNAVSWGTLEIDPTKRLKCLDYRMTTRDQTDLMIYIRAGDYLIVCYSSGGKTRASEFASGTPDGGDYLLVLKREK
jgi:uncharacterized protein (TIGR03067 family)